MAGERRAALAGSYEVRGMKIPVHTARKLRSEGMAWRDVAQEIAWATGRKFSFDSVQNACNGARRKVLRLPIPHEQELSIVHDGMIMALWKEKFDTNAIAKKLNLRESQVANRLALLRERDAA
jgi:hypothetical protein